MRSCVAAARPLLDYMIERVVVESRRALAAAPGDPLRGREVFRAQCSRCHTIWGEGSEHAMGRVRLAARRGEAR